jgi:hypothetical protein
MSALYRNLKVTAYQLKQRITAKALSDAGCNQKCHDICQMHPGRQDGLALRRLPISIRLQDIQNGERLDTEKRRAMLTAVWTRLVARLRYESQALVPHWTIGLPMRTQDFIVYEADNDHNSEPAEHRASRRGRAERRRRAGS